MSTRTTSAVITSPVRISLRVRLSSKRAAKLSCGASAGAAFDIKKPAFARPRGRGSLIHDKKPSRFGARLLSLVRPAVPAHDKGRRLPGARRGGVEQPRSGALLERCHAAQRVARVALAQILQKGGQCSSDSFFFQLFMAPFGPRLDARSKEYLESCIGEHHRAHVASFGDQAGRTPGRALPAEKRAADRRKPGDARGRDRTCLGAD